MSNRNPLLPNINPGINPSFKGNVTIAGSLAVSNDVTIGDDLTISGTATLPIVASGDVTTSTLTVSTGAQLPAAALVGASSPNLMTFGGDVPTIQTNGTVAYFVTPRAGTIVGICACPQAAIATADATLTPAIGGVTITAGTISLPFIGTAAGKPAHVVPTGANIVVAGSIISVTVGGGNTTNTSARVEFTLQYA